MGLLESTLGSIAPQDQRARALAKARLDQLTMPHWALGRLMDLAMDLAGMTGSVAPRVSRKGIVIMAGDHGVTAEGVSKYPAGVTPQMVRNFVAGGAGINALARLNGARVIVVDMGVREDLSALVEMGKIIDKRVAHGTANMAAGPAMTREQAVRALEAGITVANDLAGEFDVFGTGEMGIGNTTPGAAIVAALTGVQATEVTGHGTGISEEQRRHKADVIERALAVNRPDPRDGVDVLAKVGGFEIGGIAGLTLGAAAQRKPVVVDGFPATAGAMIAYVLCPTVSSYLIAAHRSAERGHALMQKYLGTAPLLDLHMRLGEGTGAVLAMNLVEAAARVLTEVATFDEASVSKGTP